MAYTKNTILVAPKTALDTVVGKVTLAAKNDGGELTFFVLIKVNEIEPLVQWVRGLIDFTVRMFAEESAKPAATVDRALAATRQRLVKKLRQLLLETKSVKYDDVSFCLGAVNDTHIHLTHRGDIAGYLLHGHTSTDGSRHFRWVPVTATGKSKMEKDTGLATASIVSGTGSKGDTLFMTTESILDALGLPRIENIIADEPIDGARAVLEQALMSLHGRMGFGALLLRIGETLPVAAGKTGVTASMASLEQQRQTTATLLAPEGYPAISTLKGVLRKRPGLPQAASEQIGQTLRLVAGAVIHSMVLLVTIPDRIRGKTIPTISQPRITTDRWNALMKKISHHLSQLPRRSQRLLIIALLFAYLFSQTLVYLADRQTRQQTITQNNELITSAQDKLDRAESSIIFGDDTSAAQLIAEATTLITNYPQRTTRQREERAVLEAQLKSIRERIAKVTIISDAKTIAAIPATMLAAPIGIVASKDSLYVFQSDNAVAGFTNGVLTKLPVTSVNVPSVRSVKLDDAEGIILMTDGPGLATFSSETNTLTAIPFTATFPNSIDVAFYNGRLYAVVPSEKQIYRFTNSSSGFGSPAPWLSGTAPAEVANASGIVVDGSVYVLSRSGSIIRFSAGARDTWIANAPVDASGDFKKLIGRAQSPYLYALDASQHRIVIWEKSSGKLLHQYALADREIRDFSISNDGRTLYLLSDSTILEVPLGQ
ncbi:MAG: hypothetical protein WC052_02410 [Patescibacteria group bacterium]